MRSAIGLCNGMYMLKIMHAKPLLDKESKELSSKLKKDFFSVRQSDRKLLYHFF